MKKLSLFFEDAIKAIVGIPILIGLYEIFNLIISSMMGQYVRLDGGILKNVIENTVSTGVLGYALALGFFYCARISKNKEKDEIQKSKSILLCFWIILLIVSILYGIIFSDVTTVLLFSVAFTVAFALATLVIYLLEYSINNKKKEK